MGMDTWALQGALQAAMEWERELGLSRGKAKRPKENHNDRAQPITFDLIPPFAKRPPQEKIKIKKIKNEEAQLSCSTGVQ